MVVAIRPHSSLARSAARGTAVTIVGQSLRIGTQFASIAILARLLDPVDYGYLAMVLSVIGVAELLRDFGLSAAAVQSREPEPGAAVEPVLAQHPDRRRRLAAGARLQPADRLAVRGTGADQDHDVAVAACSCSTGWPPSSGRTSTATCVSSPCRSPTSFRSWSRSEWPSPSRSRLRNYWALVAQQATVAVVGLVLAVGPGPLAAGTTAARREPAIADPLRVQPVHHPPDDLRGEQLPDRPDRRRLGRHRRRLFSRAYQLMVLPLTQIVAPLTKVALPILSQVADDPRRYASIVRRAQLLGLYLTAPLFLLCFTLSGPLVRVALGPAWAASAPIFGILALGGAFRAMSQLAFWIFLSSGSTRQQMKFNAAAYPVIVVLMVAGLPWQGVGVALGHSIGYALYWPLSLLFACRAAGLQFAPLARTAARVFGVVGFGVVGVSYAITRIGLPDLLTLAVAGVACLGYLAIVMRLVPSCRRDFAVSRSSLVGLRR